MAVVRVVPVLVADVRAVHVQAALARVATATAVPVGLAANVVEAAAVLVVLQNA